MERIFATAGLFWLLSAALLGFSIVIFGRETLPAIALKFHIHAAVLGGVLHLWVALLSERTGGLFSRRAWGILLLGLSHGALAGFAGGLLWRYELVPAGATCLVLWLIATGILAWRAFIRNGGFRPGFPGLRPHAGTLLLATGALVSLGGAAWMAFELWSSGFRFETKTAHTMTGLFGGLLLAAFSVDHIPSPGEPPFVRSWQPAAELLLALAASAGAAVLAWFGQADRMVVPVYLLGALAFLHLLAVLPRRSGEQYTAWAIGILFLASAVLLYRYHAAGNDDVRRAAHHALVLGFVLPLLLGHAYGAAGAPGASAVLSIRSLTGGAGLLVCGFILRAAGLAAADPLLTVAGAVIVVSLVTGIKVFFESAEAELPPSRGF